MYFNHQMFLTMCIFAGCDYLPQIHQIGLKTAHKLISKNKSFKKAFFELKRSDKYKIPIDY